MAGRVLGQSFPAAGRLVDLYIVPASKRTISSTITACNQMNERRTFRLSVGVGGAADARQQYIYYDTPVDANKTFAQTIGMTLSAGDVVRVRSEDGYMSFNLFGDEV